MQLLQKAFWSANWGSDRSAEQGGTRTAPFKPCLLKRRKLLQQNYLLLPMLLLLLLLCVLLLRHSTCSTQTGVGTAVSCNGSVL
jgi:hypothetical protein